jgi:pimeloyl-ACP methyl ester carboxylesterase
VRVRSTGGVELAVHDLGGQGPSLLLCHATGFHGRVWGPVAGHLAGRFHCWAPDLRGHGDATSPDDGSFDWHGFADDVLAVVDALGLEGAVAGHSKGGAALLLAELARPGTFRALWCFEPIVFPFPPRPPMAAEEHPLAAGALRRREVFPSRQEAEANYRSKPPLAALAPDALHAYVEHGFEDLPDGTVRLKCRGAEEAEVYRMGTSHGAFDRLGGVGCPVTVACGGHSTTITPDLAALLAGALPHGRAEVFDDLGHFGPMEDPAAVAGAIAAALDGSH